MAYEYDQFGNVIGEYESEIERKRRLDAQQAQTPVKQTITTNPDGTQEMTIKGTPQALSPMNPNTPTISGPVSPDDTFRRMQQIESGNRDFDAQGRPITSPAGAMFRNQVMPATAAAPGYGIRPAQSQTPEEYNRVGQAYYEAMLKKFGGDTAKAAAAYNAGPGRVEQNIRANQGQMNVAQLPRETQGYLQKLGGAVSNMIPSAQAATPESFAQNTAQRRAQTQMTPGLNARDDLMLRQPPTQAISPQQPLPDSVINDQVAAFEQRQPQAQALNLPADPFQSYIKLQENPKELINFAYDETLPENLRNRAKYRATELLTQEREMAKAKEQLPTMTENDVARALREKTTGGSYLKAMLFGMLGMEQSAMNEAAKLGIGKETMTQINGEPAMVKLAANGTPIEGYNARTGKKLSPEELITAAQFGTTQKGTEIEAGTYMDPTGKVAAGNWVLERRPGGSQYRQVGTGAIATPEQANALRKTGVGGTLADQRAKMIQDLNLKLEGKTAEEKMAILRPYNQQLVGAGFPPVNPSEIGLAAPSIGGAPAAAGGAPTTAGGAPAAAGGAPTTAGGAPAAAGGAPAAAAGPRPTAAQLEAEKTTAKEAAQEVGVDLGKIKVNQGKAEANADYLLNKIDELVGNPEKDIKPHPGFETSVGAKGASYLFGLKDKPLPPQLGGGDARNFENRMREITGQSFLQAIESLRGMGALSNVEGETATRAIQRMGYLDKDGNLVITATEDEFKKAAKDFQEVIQRGIDRNRIKLGQQPLYGTKPASETAKENKLSKLSPQDKQAIEWARQNPDDPRSAQIKQRLGL